MEFVVVVVVVIVVVIVVIVVVVVMPIELDISTLNVVKSTWLRFLFVHLPNTSW